MNKLTLNEAGLHRMVKLNTPWPVKFDVYATYVLCMSICCDEEFYRHYSGVTHCTSCGKDYADCPALDRTLWADVPDALGISEVSRLEELIGALGGVEPLQATLDAIAVAEDLALARRYLAGEIEIDVANNRFIV